MKIIDWKAHEMLRRFLNPQGKISTKRRTGVCSKHQRMLAQAVKRARHMALLPYEIR